MKIVLTQLETEKLNAMGYKGTREDWAKAFVELMQHTNIETASEADIDQLGLKFR